MQPSFLVAGRMIIISRVGVKRTDAAAIEVSQASVLIRGRVTLPQERSSAALRTGGDIRNVDLAGR